MTHSRVSSLIPLFFITLLSVGMVEGGYRLLEHFVLVPRGAGEAGATLERRELAPERRAGRSTPGYEVILKRNLFGGLSGKNTAPPPVPEKTELLAPTSLQIVLMGTVTGSEGTERAIIFDKTKRKQELYSKGEEVQGALIKEIRRGKVILAGDGREEVLDISEAAKVRPRVVPAPVKAGKPRRFNRTVPDVILPKRTSGNTSSNATRRSRVRRIVRGQ